MRLIKFSLITTILVLSTVFTASATAENIPQEESNSKTIVLAKINIQDAIIVSQENNTLNLSFNINNREGAQSGVKYGVRLVEKTQQGQKTIDEYVYPEVLSIPANSNIIKNIEYTAPSNTEGTYEVHISARNYSGLPLGTVALGKTSFTKQLNSIEILAETCSTEIERAGSIKLNEREQNIVSKEDKIILSCYIKNNLEDDVLATPVFETYYRTLYGDEVPQLGGDISPVLLRPLEEKMVSLIFPKILVPQSYVTKTYFETNGIKSNYVTMFYTVSGLSATIQNVSLDKNSYKANEQAKISFFWTSSATNREELTSISLKADIVSKSKKSCIENPLNTQLAGLGFIEIPVTISRTCNDPEVTIALMDSSGKILDQKALVFEANEKTNLFAGKTGIIAIVILVLLVIAGIIIYVKGLRKNNKDKDDSNNTPTSGHIEGAMLTIFFVIALALVPGGLVKADTFYVTVDGVYNYEGNAAGYGTVIINANLNSNVYSYGEQIGVSSSIFYDKFGWCSSFNLDIEHGQTSQEMDFAGESVVCGGDEYNAYNVLNSSVSKGEGAITISGLVGVAGTQPISINLPLSFTAKPPASVTVYAKDTSTGVVSSESITVGDSPNNVSIYWQSKESTQCKCTYQGGDCTPVGETASDFKYVFAKNGGLFSLSSSTIFTVECW